MPASNETGRIFKEALCLTCRTALSHEEECHRGPHHRVVDLRTQAGLDALLEDTWSGPEALGMLGQQRPRGATDFPPLFGDDTQLRGIAAGSPERSPLGGRPCLAYGLLLATNWPAIPGHDVIWREGAGSGFDIRLDDGGLCRVPPGPLHFLVDREKADHLPRRRVRDQLPGALGVEIPGEPRYVPFDEALEQVLRPGDPVDFLGWVELREDVTREDVTMARPFRAAAATVWVSVGTPTIRVLR